MKICPNCGWFMFKKPEWNSAKKDVELSECSKCQNCGYEEDNTERDHALDACKYSMQNLFDCSKMLAEMPPMVGVEVTLREFCVRLDEEVQKAYSKGCICVDVDLDALKKTAELNSELQSALREVLDKLPRWIPTSERLPDEELRAYKEKYPKEECIEVIVMIKGTTDTTTLYYDGKAFEDEYGRPFEVTHWMPLPDVPEVQNVAED